MAEAGVGVMSVCVYMYLCICAFMCEVCLYDRVCARVYVCLCICTFMCGGVFVCLCMYTVCVFVCVLLQG